MNVLSLFDGMSCGQIALHRAGIKVDNYFASEIKPHAIKVTQHNYPNTIQLGDVTKLDTSNLPKIDLLIGGSPCQDFSMANRTQDGLDGEKSSLFFEYYRIMQEVSPDFFLLENVEMDNFSLEKISKMLGTYPVKINSSLVSAQSRPRAYWTNIGDYQIDLLGNRWCDIPQPKNKNIKLKDILECGWTERDKAKCLLESDSRPLTTPVKMFHRAYGVGFTNPIFKDMEHYKLCMKHYRSNFDGLAAEDIICDSNIYDGIRYFTQTELEKLQTVPCGYTSILGRNDAACLLGDGWTVDVIAHIFSFLPEEYKENK